MSSFPPALIDLDRVDVDIAGAAILRGIDWRLAPGQHWGIVGANGSGKSTLLALIAGERWPAPGRGLRRYDFGDGPQSDAVQARREIVTVGPELQDRYWHRDWNFRVLDVVLSGLFRTDVPRKHPSPHEALRARAILRELGLVRLADRPFLELSRGQQRRVLIARGIAFGGRVLLLDEPASGLDRDSRRELDVMLARAAARTQLIATAHTLEDLPRPMTHWLELEAGRIVRRGPLSEFKAAVNGSAAPTRTARKPRDTAEPRQPGERETVPLIELQSADAWLGDRRVLHGVDWRLRTGEHWLVKGANGAGKSSFLRLLHGQLRPALGGSLRWPGLGEPRGIWQLRRQVAWFSPELQAGYRYHTSVRKCIASGFDSSLGLVRRLTPEEDERVERLLECFELTELAERRTTALSYGQFRRALLARALAPGPRVLLLDEPWEGLDRATGRLLAERLEESMRGGVQLVCASHLDIFEHGFTHELVLEQGRIAAAGRLTDRAYPPL